MATIVFGAVAGSWSDDTKWVGGAKPTAADDASFTVASANCTVTAGSVCRSLVMTGYTNTMSGSGDISIGDASGGALTLAGTISGTWTISFVSTSNNGGAGWSITSNGKNLVGNVTFNGVGGSWKLADAFSATSKTLTLTNGTFNTNAQSITAGAVASNNSNTRVLTITNSTLTLNVGATAWDMTTVTGLTFTATGSTISMGNSFAQFIGGGLSYGTVNYANLSAAGFVGGMSGANTFVNLGVAQTGANLTNGGLSLTNDITITGTLTLTGFTIQGNSRIMLKSSVTGTQRTITMTGAAVVIAGDAIFRDIAITGAPSWANAGSSFVGDAGGNSTLITTNRTTPSTQHYTNVNGGNWSVTADWTSRVPLPQDTVIVDAAFGGSKTLTLNMTELGGDITFAGATGTPTLSFATAVDHYGSVTLIAGMIVSGTSTITLIGRTACTITSAGQSFTNPVTINGVGGTYTLQDAFSCPADSANGALTVTLGTLNTNGQSVSVGNVSVANTASAGITLGASTVTLLRTGAINTWNVGAAASAAIVSAASSTIVIGVVSASTRTFIGGGNTYGTLTYTITASTGQLTITGANTFSTINFSDSTNARTLSLPTATTTTVSTFNVFGTATKLMTVVGDVSSNQIQRTMDYLSINNSDATGGPWYAGANSTDGGSNTGWFFGAAPSPDTPGIGFPRSSMWNNRRLRSHNNREQRDNSQTVTQPIRRQSALAA